jgi:hypothetical protein
MNAPFYFLGASPLQVVLQQIGRDAAAGSGYPLQVLAARASP